MKTDILVNQALGYYRSRQYGQAASVCQQILQEEPRNIAAIRLLGTIESLLGRYSEAAALFQQALQYDPAETSISLELGNALRLDGNPGAAVPHLRNALSAGESYQACLELGLALTELNELDDAESCFIRALKQKPDCWLSTRKLGEILTKKGKLDNAVSIFEKYIHLEPRNPHSYAELAKVHLERADPKTALAVCNTCLQIEPAYTRGFALKYIALSELGDKDGARYLYDYEKLIQRISAECPTSFNRIGDFNACLADHILNRTSMTKGSKDYTTVNGSHSGFGGLFEHNKALGEAVHKMILRAVDEYISRLPADSQHPIHTCRPSSHTIVTWAVVTEYQGYEMPHIHPKSWIGGAYYVQLPSDFDSQPVANGGWIEFGRGERGLHRLREPDTKILKPVEGDFIIFPGYFWHNTIPHVSKDKRICMAFDVQPVHGWGK